MFGISGPYAAKYLKALGYDITGRRPARERARFLADYCGAPAPALAPAAALGDMTITKASFSFTGPFNPEAVVAKLATAFTAGQNVSIVVEVAKVAE